MSDYIYPESHPVVPYLTVADPLAMAAFYEKAFGFQQIERVDDEAGKPIHIGMGYEGKAIVMFSPQSPPDEQTQSPKISRTAVPITIFVYHPDVDALFKQAITSGAQSISEPEDMFWGDRVCRLRDLENYRWAFSTYTGKKFDP